MCGVNLGVKVGFVLMAKSVATWRARVTHTSIRRACAFARRLH